MERRNTTTMIEEFLEEMRQRGWADTTRKNSRYCLLDFKEFIGETRLSRISQKDVLRFLGRPELQTPATKNTYLAWIISFMDYLIREGVLPKGSENPGRGIKRYKRYTEGAAYDGSLPEGVGHKLYLTAAEVGGLRLQVVIGLGLFLGLRRFEIAKARWVDTDLVGGRYSVVAGKGGKNASLPIPDAFLQTLKQYHLSCEDKMGYLFPSPQAQHEHLSVDGIEYLIRTASEPLGFKCKTHALRHTFATTLHEAGVDLFEISALLRHESVATTAIYIGKNPNTVRAAVNRLDWRRPSGLAPKAEAIRDAARAY